MKITICSSNVFVDAIMKIAEELRALGHTVLLPNTAERVMRGELTLDDIRREKATGDIMRTVAQDAIRVHHEKIKASEAILVLNLEKNSVQNAIGGNVFLEIGFAYILGKKIFLLNDIPNVPYADEIRVMQPVILHRDYTKIVG